jgi:hypothetical protein
MKMREVKKQALKKGVNLGKMTKTELVRNIQIKEGHTPCFQTGAFGTCVQLDCCWMAECGKSG